MQLQSPLVARRLVSAAAAGRPLHGEVRRLPRLGRSTIPPLPIELLSHPHPRLRRSPRLAPAPWSAVPPTAGSTRPPGLMLAPRPDLAPICETWPPVDGRPGHTPRRWRSAAAGTPRCPPRQLLAGH